jgi:PleD family two-component response regulator
VAEQLRQDVEDRKILHPGSSVSPWLTISVGGASMIPTTTEPDPGFFGLADTCLYQAKEAGRNRVVWARDIPE